MKHTSYNVDNSVSRQTVHAIKKLGRRRLGATFLDQASENVRHLKKSVYQRPAGRRAAAAETKHSRTLQCILAGVFTRLI
jgi:hypothetical protein